MLIWRNYYELLHQGVGRLNLKEMGILGRSIMIRRILTITMLVLVCAAMATAGEQVKWTGNGGDTSWTNPANWQGDKVPGPHDIAILNPPPNRGPVIDVDIQCGEMRGPTWNSSETQVVDVVGCNVVIEGWWRWTDRGRGQGIININRANVSVGGVLRSCDGGKTYSITNITDSVLTCKGVKIGDGGNGEINIKGNTLMEVEEFFNLGGSSGDNGRTYEDKPLAITMDGGILRIGRTFQCPADGDRAGVITVELTAGVLTCNSFTHTEVPYSMNLEEGVFMIDGDVTEDIKKDIEAGYITAFGGKDTVRCRYSKRSKRTIVTAANRKAARRARPGNRSVEVKPDTKLTWRAGSRGSKNTYDVYIGTTLDAVAADAKPVAKGLAIANFDPDLDFGKTYHWRVDAIDEAGTVHKGTTWQFTTTDGKATGSAPADKGEKVASNATLTWKPGLAAASSTVYLGSDPEKLSSVATTASGSFTPKNLELGKTYYWRVDGASVAWKQSPWKGNVWSFTVDSGKATNPMPIDLAQWKPTKATLSWDAARTATAHTVYISDKLEDVEKGVKAVSKAQKGTTYAAANLKEATTYYWRVDQVTGDTVIKGDIWKFSTVGMLDLKMDLAVPQWYDRTKPIPGTAKPGWYALCSPKWADMYMHDGAWLPAGKTQTPAPEGILGTGIQMYIDNGKGGNAAVTAHGLCRGGLGGELPTFGLLEGDPIANTYFFAADWAGQKNGDAFVLIKGLPAGEYEVKSYHNHWEPSKQGTRNCHDHVSGMPPMPSVIAKPVPEKPYPGYNSWGLPAGTGKGVISLLEAKNIKVTSVFSDDEVATSVIKFSTDGSDVLIIYEAADNSYPDRARSGREGARGIWNAMELKMLDWAK